MSSVWGNHCKISLFGESHGSTIGVTLDGFPPGVCLDMAFILAQIARRSPQRFQTATKRVEADVPTILSGVHNGFTTGSPITAIFKNSNVHRGDYDQFQDTPRPGHADYTAGVKYKGFADLSGGGHLSGRLTLPMVFAGALAKLALQTKGITVAAHLSRVGHLTDLPLAYLDKDLTWYEGVLTNPLPTISPTIALEMQAYLDCISTTGNSVSGGVECGIYGLNPGVGSPIFGNIESRIASFIFAIPGVKSLTFGQPPQDTMGTAYNDCFTVKNQAIATKTNHCGGILGGISNGMPIYFETLFKPTPSIFISQKTLNRSTLEQTQLEIKGRHDPCITLRAVPVVEAATAITILDIIMEVQYEQN